MQRLLQLLSARRVEIKRFIKFLFVGGMGFAIDFGVFNVLIQIVHFEVWMANPISFGMAVINNYLWNRYWIYPETRDQRKREQLPTFFVVSVLGLAINTGVLVVSLPFFAALLTSFGLVIDHGAENLAKVLATGVVLFWNFFVNRFVTFRRVDRKHAIALNETPPDTSAPIPPIEQ